MAAMTDYLENKLVDFLFRGQALGLANATAAAGSGCSTLYFGLLLTPTASPVDGSSFTELTVGTSNYSRATMTCTTTNFDNTQQLNTTAVSSGSTATTRNSTVITFPTPSAGWGTVYGIGVFDSAAGSIASSMIIYALLTTSKTINSGDSVTFPINAFTFQIDN